MIKPLTRLSLLVIVVVTAGVILFGREFVKIRLGPLFLLEWAVLAWTALTIRTLNQPLLSNFSKHVWPISLFFCWGSLLILVDIYQSHLLPTPIPWMRVLQHAILFVYPLIWCFVGYGMRSINERYVAFLSIATLLVATVPHFVGSRITNVSAGPLAVLPLVYYSQVNKVGLREYLLSGFFAVLIFFPFWTMWLTSVQRTSLILLIWMILTAPFLIRKPNQSYWTCIRTSSWLLTLFVAGSLTVIIASTGKYLPEAWRRLLLSSLQHGEDVPSREDSSNFQMRTRKFMWSQTIEDWSKRPIVGIGFVPEVPSYIRPDRKNDGGFEFPGSPPVSGPHNSYLSILARMGLIGAGLFLIVLLWLGNHMFRVGRTPMLELADLPLFYFPANGILHAIVNVGFESPHNSALAWLFVGILVHKSVQVRSSRRSPKTRPESAR